MKKRIGIAITLALAFILCFSAAALAATPPTATVVCSDIDAPDEAFVGADVTASGTVTVTSTVDTRGFIPVAIASSDAGFSVVAPDSTVVDSGSISVVDADIGLFRANADASQVYNWSSTFTLTQEGGWVVSQSGDAWVYWGKYFGLPPNSYSGNSGNSAVIIANIHEANYNRYRHKCFFDDPDYTDPTGSYWDWTLRSSNYTFFMPAGTEIIPEPDYLKVKILNGVVTFGPSDNFVFSQPVSVYKLVDGAWVVVATFTQVVNGQVS